MSRYSPSSRQDYNKCARRWWLRKRYKTRAIEYPELCAMVGSAVGESQHYWNTCRMQSKPVTLEELIALGLQSFTEQMAEEIANDRRLGGLKAHEAIDTLPAQIETAIKLLWEKDPLFGTTILAAEKEYPDFGNARLDVLVKRTDGIETVWDYKVKLSKLNVQYVQSALDEYLDSEQRMVYTYMTGTTQFGIIMIALNMVKNLKPIKPDIFAATKSVTPEEHTIWLRDAEMDYSEMSEIEILTDPKRVRGKSYPHGDKYGECPFAKACLEYNLDAELMKTQYVQIEKGV